MSTNYAYQTVTSDITLDNTATVWYFDTTSNDITATLPSLSTPGVLGTYYIVKRLDTSNNILILQTASNTEFIEVDNFYEINWYEIYAIHARTTTQWNVLNYNRF